MLRVCFATFEISPFTGGGIGTFMKHLLTLHGLDERIEPSVLWYGSKPIDEATFRIEYPRCRLYLPGEWLELDEVDNYPSEDSYDRRFRQSLQLMKALRAIERKDGPFDFIEFPDFGGVALATLQEKHMGRGFAPTRIAVRVHSTEAMLRRYDHRAPTFENALVYDFERKGLSDADVVVAALTPVATSVQKAMNFPESWLDKVIIEPHPFLPDRRLNQAFQFSPDTPLTFTSKIQWFKAPHVFINGVVGFMRSTPEYKGHAYLLAHVISEELQKHCEALIPFDLRSRFTFEAGLPNATRNALIAKSVSIYSSRYESFCNAAYEASHLGAAIILNGENPAFGVETPWAAGVNCEKFDGSAAHLSSVLRDVWQRGDKPSYKPVQISNAQVPYWLRDFPSTRTETSASKLAAVVIACGEYGNALDTIRSLLSMQHPNLEICLAYDASLDEEEDLAAIRRLEEWPANATITIVRLDCAGGPAALANLGLKNTSSDYIAFARAGMIFDPEFLQSATTALNSNSAYSFVLPQVSHEAADASGADIEPVYGELLNSMFLGRNMLGHLEFVGRRDPVNDLAFDEYLDRDVAWDFFIRAALAGNKSIVSNRVDAICPRSIVDRSPRYFRSHPDSIFVKHSLDTPAFGQFRLVSAYDAVDAPDVARESDQIYYDRLARYEQLRSPKGIFIRAAFRLLAILLDWAIAISNVLGLPHTKLTAVKDKIWNHEYRTIWPILTGRRTT